MARETRHGGSVGLLGAFAVVLAACSSMTGTPAPPPEPNIVPTNYKQEIIDSMLRILPDATNVRSAFITDPFLSVAPGGREQRYIVCVRYNGRDANRQYIGSKDRVGTFFAGRLNQLVDTGTEQCTKALFKPFPELERLCQVKTCD
jgi:hypothetical protein